MDLGEFMTSRTIDIYCRSCRNYLFSLQPDDRDGLGKDYYCKLEKCQEKATIEKLKGKDTVVIAEDE